jgi:tetratricopeptide (TPR) repeat protein
LTDLPAPKPDFGDLPAPKNVPSTGHFVMAEADEGLADLDDLPLPVRKSSGAALEVEEPEPSRGGARAEAPDLLTPKPPVRLPPREAPQEGPQQMPDDDAVFRFEAPRPSTQEDAASRQAEDRRTAPVPADEEEAASRPRKPSKWAALRGIGLMWIGAGVGIFVLVAGLTLGLLTDFGFFGMSLLTGSYAKRNTAKTQMASAVQALRLDTFQGYSEAATSLEAAASGLRDDPEPKALWAQTLTAMLARFGPNPSRRTQAEELLAKLVKNDAKSREVAKAQALSALTGGRASEAVSQLKALSDQEPGDFRAAVYLGWSCLASRDSGAAEAAFSRAFAAQPGLPAALFGMAKVRVQLKDAKGAEAWIAKTLAAVPRHAGALLLHADLLLSQGGSSKPAQALLKQVVGLGSSAAPSELSLAMALLGQTLLNEGENNQAHDLFEKALRLNPENPAACLGMGQFLSSARQYTEAVGQFRRAQSLDPTNIRAASFVARTVIAMGKPLEARTALQDIIKVAPDAPEIPLLQGMVDEAVGNLETAERYLKEAVRKNPTDFETYQHLSQIYLRQSKPEEALRILEEAETKIPVSPRVRNAAGLVHYSAKRLDQARTKFEEALSLDPSLNEARFNLSRVLAGQGKLEEAEKNYLLLKQKDKTFPGLAASLGALYLETKEYAKAAAAYDEAMSQESPSVELVLSTAKANLLAGKPDKVLSLTAKALQLDPTTPAANALRAEARLLWNSTDEALVGLGEIQLALEREKKADYYITLGKILEVLNKPPEAIDAYTEVLKIDPSQMEVRLRRAVLLVKGGTVKDGLAELDQVLKTNPSSAEAYFYKGDALSDLGQESQSLASYQTAVAKNPKYGAAHMKIAQIYYDTHRASEALPHLDAATKNAAPADRWVPDAYYLLGVISLERNQRKAAIDAFSSYLKIAPPRAPFRQQVEQKLKSLGASREK